MIGPFYLRNEDIKRLAIQQIQRLPVDQDRPLVLQVKEMTRSLEQNAAQWPILKCISKQLQWPVNGQMVYLNPDEWKDVLTAAFKGEKVRLAMGVYGGVVMLGQRTSGFGVRKFSEWLEFLNYFAADRGVNIYIDEEIYWQRGENE